MSASFVLFVLNWLSYFYPAPQTPAQQIKLQAIIEWLLSLIPAPPPQGNPQSVTITFGPPVKQ